MEKNVSELKEEFDRVSAELQNALQNFSKIETEKQVCFQVALEILKYYLNVAFMKNSEF